MKIIRCMMKNGVTVSRFSPMLFSKRTLARVTLPRAEEAVEELVESLMGRKPELRFRFIQENAEFAVADLDV